MVTLVADKNVDNFANALAEAAKESSFGGSQAGNRLSGTCKTQKR
jgi:hypothetical protein